MCGLRARLRVISLRVCVCFVFVLCSLFCFDRNEEAAALFLRCAEAWVNADEPGVAQRRHIVMRGCVAVFFLALS